MADARAIYQNPAIEVTTLLIPLLVHWTAAVLRLRRDGFRRTNQTLRARLHRYTGYFLLVFIWGHVAATRSPSLLVEIEVGFTAISFTFAWLPYWFYPYYAALGASALYHTINGAMLAIAIFGGRVPSGLRYGPGFWLPMGALALALMLGLAGLSSHLYAVPDPFDSDFATLVESMMP